MTDSIPQLRMGFTRFDASPEPGVPSGYALRTFREGDEDGWLSVLGTGGWDAWDRDRLDALLTGGHAEVPRDGIVFATQNERSDILGRSPPEYRWLPQPEVSGEALRDAEAAYAALRVYSFHYSPSNYAGGSTTNPTWAHAGCPAAQRLMPITVLL